LLADDVDLDKNHFVVSKGVTLDENGRVTIGETKNSYSLRTISLLPITLEIINEQLSICRSLDSKFLFCTETGAQVQRDNLRSRVWEPALLKAGIPYRPMIQTRHTFATTALSLGENALWIAKTMGHSTPEMLLKVYAKYVENMNGSLDGGKLNHLYQKESKPE
jgi:integrase